MKNLKKLIIINENKKNKVDYSNLDIDCYTNYHFHIKNKSEYELYDKISIDLSYFHDRFIEIYFSNDIKRSIFNKINLKNRDSSFITCIFILDEEKNIGTIAKMFFNYFIFIKNNIEYFRPPKFEDFIIKNKYRYKNESLTEIFNEILSKHKDISIEEIEEILENSYAKNIKTFDLTNEDVVNSLIVNNKLIHRDKQIEETIKNDPSACFVYIKNLGPFPEGEKAIATSAEFSFKYAKEVIKRRFPEGEKAIATSAKYSFEYARDIIKGRWLEGEKIILTSRHTLEFYISYVVKKRVPEIEDYIKNISDSYERNSFLYSYNNGLSYRNLPKLYL